MKRLLSVILALCLTLSCAVTAFAAPADACACGKYPVIVVSGVGAQPFMLDAGTENEQICFPPTVDVSSILRTAACGLFRTVTTRSFRAFAEAVAQIAMDILGVIACDENGNSLYNVTPVLFDSSMDAYNSAIYEDAEDAEFSILRTAVHSVGADHTYYYNYDWRLDPMANAEDLNAFIDNVLAETGHSKVRLIAASMGGVQTTAYLGKYGHDKVDTIVFMSSAFYGLLFVTNVFTGELILDQNAFFSWLQTIETGKPKLDTALYKVFGFCAKTVLLKPVFTLLNKIAVPLNEVAVSSVMKQVFGTMPGMWSFVRDERYEEAKKTLCADAPESFIAMIDTYHYDIQCKKEEILRAAKADGVKICVLSHYNNGNVPITSSAMAHGDSLIETACTSGGATVADFGSTLPAGYVQHGCTAHNHLSADGIIDASTCLFPDSTWFVKNMDHVGCRKDSAYSQFLAWILAQDEQPTVFDDARYPQFMQTDRITQMDLQPVQ
ncbi:MAG: alpha/beta fold hydrolase [Oscillospiraceae bacterium]|nr:alpha/beta fold hydrolase [Oscillospiraceae bacterium]